MRIVKTHSERYAEFLAVARRLFSLHGYDEVSVEAITRSMGVSKGTFYHYFSSKEDLLDRMVEDFTSELLERAGNVLEGSDLPAERKIEDFFVAIRSFKMENLDLVSNFTRCILDPRNRRFRDKYYRVSLEMFTPHLAGLIREGIETDRCYAMNPEYTAEILMILFLYYGESISRLIFEEVRDSSVKREVMLRMDVLVRAMERILGLPPKTIHLVEPAVISRFLSSLEETKPKGDIR